jgi:hypothetical protein
VEVVSFVVADCVGVGALALALVLVRRFGEGFDFDFEFGVVPRGRLSFLGDGVTGFGVLVPVPEQVRVLVHDVLSGECVAVAVAVAVADFLRCCFFGEDNAAFCALRFVPLGDGDGDGDGDGNADGVTGRGFRFKFKFRFNCCDFESSASVDKFETFACIFKEGLVVLVSVPVTVPVRERVATMLEIMLLASKPIIPTPILGLGPGPGPGLRVRVPIGLLI